MDGVGTGSVPDKELAASFSLDTLSSISVIGVDTDDTGERKEEREREMIKLLKIKKRNMYNVECIHMNIKPNIHQAILLQAICGYFDVVSNVLPRIEHVSILGNSVA